MVIVSRGHCRGCEYQVAWFLAKLYKMILSRSCAGGPKWHRATRDDPPKSDVKHYRNVAPRGCARV